MSGIFGAAGSEGNMGLVLLTLIGRGSRLMLQVLLKLIPAVSHRGGEAEAPEILDRNRELIVKDRHSTLLSHRIGTYHIELAQRRPTISRSIPYMRVAHNRPNLNTPRGCGTHTGAEPTQVGLKIAYI